MDILANRELQVWLGPWDMMELLVGRVLLVLRDSPGSKVLKEGMVILEVQDLLVHRERLVQQVLMEPQGLQGLLDNRDKQGLLDLQVGMEV